MHRMGKPHARRYWDEAIAKRDREGRCRVCGSQFFLQAAHTLARSFDERVPLEDGTVMIYVEPDDVVPLCETHHRDYDMRRLSLLPYLTYDEQAAAVAHVGIVRALHRLTAHRELPLTHPALV